MNTLPEKFEDLEQSIANDMKPCIKRPIVIKAKKMYAGFRVKSMEGDYKTGKPGDYLMCGIDNELYICDADIFERTYDFVAG